MQVQNLFFIAAGIFSICGAAFQWPFFMDGGKARSLAKFIGRTGARIFYVAIGIVLIALGAILSVVR